ncbi:MAG: hypothetical protein ACI4HI_08110 [Lachnospiraceae bacterium]
MPPIICLMQQEGCHNSYHLYVIRVENRDAMFEKLTEEEQEYVIEQVKRAVRECE